MSSGLRCPTAVTQVPLIWCHHERPATRHAQGWWHQHEALRHANSGQWAQEPREHPKNLNFGTRIVRWPKPKPRRTIQMFFHASQTVCPFETPSSNPTVELCSPSEQVLWEMNMHYSTPQWPAPMYWDLSSEINPSAKKRWEKINVPNLCPCSKWFLT